MATMNTLESSIFLGLNAGVALTTGTDNIVVSPIAGGQALTTGSDNVLIGDNVAPVLATGSSNTIIGGDSATLMTGSNNTTLGYGAGVALVAGASNTLIGKGAGASLASGSNNVIIGNIAGGAADSATIQVADGAGVLRLDYGKTNAAGVTVVPTVATAAGSAATPALLWSTTANLGIFWGSGAPSFAAAQGALYVRTDGSSTSTRLYVNTTGSTTWTNVTTAA